MTLAAYKIHCWLKNCGWEGRKEFSVHEVFKAFPLGIAQCGFSELVESGRVKPIWGTQDLYSANF